MDNKENARCVLNFYANYASTGKNSRYLNKITQGDCIEIMRGIEDESIDLIFADPPYNLQLQNELFRPNQSKVDGVDDNWDKFKDFKEYDAFTFSWLKECKRVLKKTGTLWVIGSYHNIFRVGKILQDLDYWILNDIIWIKSNPMPNFKGTRFTNAHETLIWCSKSEKGTKEFNYKSMKVYNDDKQMRSDWYIPICSGNERLKGEDGKKLHSTQKPYELLYRVILSSSKENDVVLDPFSGSGTTCFVAKELKRNYIGIEKDEKYIKYSIERLQKAKLYDSSLLSLEVEKKPPKIPFGSLVANNYIQVGEILYSKNEEIESIVLANGTIRFGKLLGSIHKISASILNKNSNNGWTYWYVKRNGTLISINDLRYKFDEKEIK